MSLKIANLWWFFSKQQTKNAKKFIEQFLEPQTAIEAKT
jgi:hypothetical protein